MNNTDQLSQLQQRFARGEISKAAFITDAYQLHQTLWTYLPHLRRDGVHEIRVADAGVSFLMGEERVWIETPGGETRVAPVEALNFGLYEPDECAAMNVLAANASCILDVGANIGFHTLRLATREPLAKVHAFEPVPQHFEYLCRNVAANGAGSRCRTYNFGLSRASGTFPFFVAPGNSTNASLANVARRDDATRVVGLALTLDEWATNFNARPDFIKIDVEGAELWVLEGGRKTIEEHTPRVFAELLRKWSSAFGYHPTDILRFFAELGYGCWAISAHGIRRLFEVGDETPETNFAFLHEHLHADFIHRLLTGLHLGRSPAS